MKANRSITSSLDETASYEEQVACRLCPANDREALIEDLAPKFWEGERDNADGGHIGGDR
jgi:hypothetical protein